MALSLLVILRDQGLPMPAGAVLLSPWVDLTHSFPSCAGENVMDYVPANGFVHAPSMSWPPPNMEQLKTLDNILVDMGEGNPISARILQERSESRLTKGKQTAAGSSTGDAVRVTDIKSASGQPGAQQRNARPGVGDNLSVAIDGKNVELEDQIQIYTTNALSSHPLVSPILQPSLGGLPPLCILVGGSEMLRDEQIYLAHKAADPDSYPPPTTGDAADQARIIAEINRWPATFVQLQIWDDLCHVAPTLSWTRPAKYMFRSVAQFGAWALARAQRSEIRIMDDDEVSLISSDSEDEPSQASSRGARRRSKGSTHMDNGIAKDGDASASGRTPSRQKTRVRRPDTPTTVGRAGDPLPSFKEHMIRHRVTRHGDLYALDPPSTLVACTMDPKDIGSIKPGPVRKWLAGQEKLVNMFGDEKKKIQARRMAQMADTMGGKGAAFTEGRQNSILIGQERPPPTAWAGRSKEQIANLLKGREKTRISKGLAMWSGWGSKHDEQAIENEQHKIKNKEDVTMSVTSVRVRNRPSIDYLGGATGVGIAGSSVPPGTALREPSTNSKPRRAITPIHTDRTLPLQPYSTPATTGTGTSSHPGTFLSDPLATPAVSLPTTARPITPSPLQLHPSTTNANRPIIASSTDPTLARGTIPFKLASSGRSRANPSTMTLQNAEGALMPESGNPIPDSATLPAAGTPYRYSHRSVYGRDTDSSIPPTPALMIPATPTTIDTNSPTTAPTSPHQQQYQTQQNQQTPTSPLSPAPPTNGTPHAYTQPNNNNRIETPPSRPTTASSPRSQDHTHTHRPFNPSVESIDDVPLSAAQAVPLRTAEAARREHARASSKVYDFSGDSLPGSPVGSPNGPLVGRVGVTGVGGGAGVSGSAGASASGDSAGGVGASASANTNSIFGSGGGTGARTSRSELVSGGTDMESWADRVISEVRTVGSREGTPVVGGSGKGFENSGP